LLPSAGKPTGTVTVNDPGKVLGSALLDNTAPATFSTAALAVGNQAITTSYNTDENLTASGPSRHDGYQISKSGATAAARSNPNPSVVSSNVVTAVPAAVAAALATSETGPHPSPLERAALFFPLSSPLGEKGQGEGGMSLSAYVKMVDALFSRRLARPRGNSRIPHDLVVDWWA
jgi:hypothetical protein